MNRSNKTTLVLLSIIAVAGLFSLKSCLAQVAPPATTIHQLPTPLTLQEALSIAVRQQPQIYIALTQQTQASGQKTQAQAQYFPTVTPAYQYQNGRQTQYGSDISIGPQGQIIRNQTFDTSGGSGTLSLTQKLFDNGSREITNAQARRQIDATGFNTVNVRQSIILTVTQDYYAVLRDIDQVKVSQANVTRYQQTLDLTQAQVTAGTAAAISTYQAQADLANAQVTLLQNQNSVLTDSAALKNAMGVETDAVVQPALLATGDQLPPLPNAGVQRTLDADVQTAYAHRPDIKEQQAVVESQNLAVKQAMLNAGLQISGDYALTYTPHNDLGAKGSDSQFLLSASYPLFDAGSAHAAVRIAEAQRDAAKDQLEQTKQNVRLAVEQAYVQRSEALQSASLALAAVNAGSVNYNAAVESRKAGVSTFLDVTTAEATLTQAQGTYVAAVYNFYIADAALSRAIGENDAR